MLDDLCQLLKAENFGFADDGHQSGGIFAFEAPIGAPRPHLVAVRAGGDRNQSLDGDDDSLVFTDVSLEIRATNAADALAKSKVVVDFLREYQGPMGNRVAFCFLVDDPQDAADQPNDSGDAWNVLITINAHVEHGAAA